MCESYNGYKNRETWALCLWLNNDQGDQEQALERAETALSEWDVQQADKRQQARYIGQAIEAWFDEMTADAVEDPSARTGDLLRMLFDIGSLYRVDWDEVGSHFIPSDHGR